MREFHGTETNFVNHEVLIWGEDYIYDLIERGYTPTLTDTGWRWVLTSPANEASEIGASRHGRRVSLA